MINKHSIYNWLFFPLLASLLAGSAASCINDPAMEEDTSGKSTLSIMVRGVTTNPEQDGYDEYIETLRIIGFDAKRDVVCNQLFDYDASTDDVPDFIIQGTGEDTKINITQTLEEAFQGGTCDFYFIANEKDYTVHNTQSNTQSLSNFLDEVSLDGLKNCVIAYSGKEPGATNTLPILMTTSVRTTLRPGDNTINNIELVRCFAKIQLKIVDETGIASIGGENKLTGTYPGSYSLWNGGTYIDWYEGGAYSVSLTLTRKAEDNAISHTSQEIYFPERLFDQNSNTEDNALKFSFTLNGTSYTAAVADAAGKDFNIRRNTHYTVIATLKKKETVTFNVMVNAWGEKTMDVPAFE